MSNINGVGSNNPVNRIINNPIYRDVSTEPATRTSAVDRLELSGVSHLLGSLKSNDVRTDKVTEVKALIESGKYEDNEKLDIAVDRMLDDVLK